MSLVMSICLSVMVFDNHYGSCCTNCGCCPFSIQELDMIVLWIVLFSSQWRLLLCFPTCTF